MGWKYPDTLIKPVVKKDGECRVRSQWKYCPYWSARHSTKNKKVTVFRCMLFDLDKDSKNSELSLPICNRTYGRDYDGPP
jgi:hypothetical protein